MPHSGAELGADLYDLYKVATINLPDVAHQYKEAATQVGNTDSSVSTVFTRHREFGGSQGLACQPWLDLRDTIMKYLSDTSANLEDTAQALLMAVEGYSASDWAAATTLNELKSRDKAE